MTPGWTNVAVASQQERERVAAGAEPHGDSRSGRVHLGVGDGTELGRHLPQQLVVEDGEQRGG